MNGSLVERSRLDGCLIGVRHILGATEAMVVIRTLCTVLLVLAAAPVRGQDHAWRAGFEVANDFFITFDPNTATDHEYTHGTRAWMESERFDLLHRLLPKIVGCQESHRCRHRVMVGQEIYTPRREAAVPIEGERPHAGWLYTSIETKRVDPRGATTFRAQFGIVGPPAFAEEVQTAIHRWFSFRVPQGWEHQLPFEPTIQLYLFRVADVAELPGDALGLAAGYGVGADVGNALTQGEARIQAHACLGKMLCSSVHAPATAAGIVLRGFVGARGVLRNVFLDGTLRDSHSVTRDPLLPIAVASIAVHLSRVVAEYEVSWRGREYRSEPTGFRFGTLRLQLEW